MPRSARSIPLPKFVARIESIDGLKEWEEANNRQVEERAAVHVQEHAEKVAARARELVPVKSGLLQSTIRVTKGKDPLKAYVKTDHGKAPHDYLVHFGTVKSEGRPFLYQASEQLKGDLVGALKTEFE